MFFKTNRKKGGEREREKKRECGHLMFNYGKAKKREESGGGTKVGRQRSQRKSRCCFEDVFKKQRKD